MGLFEELKSRVEEKRVVVVLGAGVSTALSGNDPRATWRGFLEAGIDYCLSLNLVERDTAATWRQLLGSKNVGADLPTLAALLTRPLEAPKGPEFANWLQGTIGKFVLRDRSLVEPLRGLGAILTTTNYDGLLEEATGLPAVTWLDSERCDQLLERQIPGILHLHGFWNEPESVILDLRSYDRLAGVDSFQVSLKRLLGSHSFVFIGTGDGLEDPTFATLRGWIGANLGNRKHHHYQLVLESALPTEAGSVPKDRLYPLSYGVSYKDLPGFLQSLVPAEPARPVAQPQPAPGAVIMPRLFCSLNDGFPRTVDELPGLLKDSTTRLWFLLGAPGSGKHELVERIVGAQRAQTVTLPKEKALGLTDTTTDEVVLDTVGREIERQVGPNPGQVLVVQELDSLLRPIMKHHLFRRIILSLAPAYRILVVTVCSTPQGISEIEQAIRDWPGCVVVRLLPFYRDEIVRVLNELGREPLVQSWQLLRSRPVFRLIARAQYVPRPGEEPANEFALLCRVANDFALKEWELDESTVGLCRMFRQSYRIISALFPEHPALRDLEDLRAAMRNGSLESLLSGENLYYDTLATLGQAVSDVSLRQLDGAEERLIQLLRERAPDEAPDAQARRLSNIVSLLSALTPIPAAEVSRSCVEDQTLWPALSGAWVRGFDLSGRDLKDLDFRYTWFDRCNLSTAKLPSLNKLAYCRLDRCRLLKASSESPEMPPEGATVVLRRGQNYESISLQRFRSYLYQER